MIPRLRMAAAFAAAYATLAGPAARAEVAPSDGAVASAILDAARTDNWPQAEGFARQAADPAARDIALWLRLASDDGVWREYVDFIASHADWPRMEAVRASAERHMPSDLPPAQVKAFFASDRPITGTGAIRLSDALMRAGDRLGAQDTIIAAWGQLELTGSERAAFQAKYPSVVAQWSDARLDNLIWEGDFAEAEATYPFASPGQVALARARIALRTDRDGVDGFIAAVPARLVNDPGLAYDRFQWRLRRDRWDDAEALILQQSTSAVALGRPSAWAPRRLSLAHRAMRRGDNATAYRIASNHYMSTGGDFEELEWFAGWLALRKLGDPKSAVAHFRKFRDHVDTPISVGRAGYWLGRAEEALGDRSAARSAYADAARYQTSFYGQLAAERAGLSPDSSLAGSGRKADWRKADFMKRSSGRAALMFHYAGEPGRVWQFLIQLARHETDTDELAAVTQMALDLGYPHIAVRAAKIAAGKGIVLMNTYYPLTDLAAMRGPVAPELALAIARQESEFNQNAVSPVGARGLMQLMPGTAQKVSREIGVGYSASRLTSDWQYNATLGQTYLAGLLNDFGSVPLAAAGYNAGPSRVRSWIDQFGDPRSPGVDMIDWIETIPFSETRNYVMRVVEGLHVYRARLAGKATPLRIAADLGEGK
ncbi:lytic transglycosylase domain-containing protein [Paroceanicella profunda]|uniref:Lytic transglycosylase domain-containing protein n=1 Tax=Paroceanicella profunda TaxID=2579971 RepID=A0A5B8FH72_9RHOB|nr:lytic transglycosylase domain-containing protein [Paroceanicella profunda]QDL92081.1 lytic transglycosylase domain-containing protein [Paroceanicella profunda]